MTFEITILTWIQNNVVCGALNWLKYVTRFADKGLGWIVLALILLCFKKTRRIGIFCAAALVLDVVVVNGIVKPLVDRTRPYIADSSLMELVTAHFPNKAGIYAFMEDDASFPSGHTAASFAAAWSLLRYRSKKQNIKLFAVLALVLAVIIGLSRLYIGVHYPTDVLAGMVFGIVCAEIARPIVKFIRRRIPKKVRKRFGI